MDILQSIIKSLAKEEIKSYKLFAKRTHNFENRKDIELFESIKTHTESSDNYHNHVIYQKPNIDAKYYRLKNKIADDLGVVLTHLNHRKPDIDALHLFSLAKIFNLKKNHSLSYHYLKLAERRALEREDYALLEAIYEQMIRFSAEVSEMAPTTIIEKRNENVQRLNLLRDLENNLAILSHEVKTTQNLVPSKSITTWLHQTLKHTLELSYVKNSPNLRIKVFQNLSRLLLLLNDYQSLESYLKTCFIEFEKEHLFNQETHDVKLQLLVYLCNASFKLNKHAQLLHYADILNKSLVEHHKLLYDQYLFYYYNILVTSYWKNNLEKAIDVLIEAQQQTAIKNNAAHFFYVLSNLAVGYFNAKKFKLANKLFSQMYVSANYKTVGVVFQLQLSLFELITKIELEDIESCEKQLLQVQKMIAEIKDKNSVKPENDVIKLLAHFLSQEDKRWRPLKPMAQTIIKNYPADSAESQSRIINYSEWLSTKF